MRIPDTIIEEISNRINIVEVIGGYVALQRKGTRYWARCPFHNEKTPSFTILPDGTGFYCFGCQKGGSVFTFIQEIEHFSFREAAEFLAKKAGVEIPVGAGEQESASQRKALVDLYGKVGGSLNYILLNSEKAAHARGYLAGRSVRDDIVRAFLLGYAPSDRRWLYGFLRKKSYSAEFLAETGLFPPRYPQSSFFGDRLMFPITNQRGEIIAFGGRALGKQEPKYMNSPDTSIFSKSANLYGLSHALPAARKIRTFMVAEGYMDVLALHAAGVVHGVAPLGTALTGAHVRLMKRYVEKCILVFDGDAAGIRAAERGVTACETEGLSCEVVLLPDGLDPADLLEKQGPEALQTAVNSPINGFTFVLNNTLRNRSGARPEDKAEIVRSLLPFVDAIQSEVRREGYLDEIADALGISKISIVVDLDRMRTVRHSSADGQVPARQAESLSPDLYLMLALAVHRGAFASVRGSVTAENLRDEQAKELYLALEECFRADEVSLENVITRIGNDRLVRLVLEKNASGEYAQNADRIVQDAVLRIRQRNMKEQRDAVTRKVAVLEKQPGKDREIRTLLEEIVYLDEELKSTRERGI